MEPQTVVEKYLEHYAEPETKAFSGLGFHFENVLVIPAFNEKENLLTTLESIKEKNCLVILVVNAGQNSSKEVVDTNSTLLRNLRKQYYEIWRAKLSQGVSLHQMFNCTLLIIDRSSGSLKLPENSGVGLARKIGADVALQLIHQKNISKQWIHSTDADVILPSDYFSRTTKLSNTIVAAIYPYEHFAGKNNTESVYLYELALRHYVIGLKQAGSPYAFHTIGSTIAVKADSYAKVRGFPKRQAGEDFYMLNKLVKLGPIEHLSGAPIQISGRISNRTPFGTGQAVKKIGAFKKPIEEYKFYNPNIFKILKFWLNELKNLTPSSNMQKFEQLIRQKAKYPQLITGLEKLGAFQAIKNILNQCSDSSASMRQIHTWFDGFRTLKLIHHMRDNGHQCLSLNDLFEHPPYDEYKHYSNDDLSTLCQHFAKLESCL